jgi:hypothetical protein
MEQEYDEPERVPMYHPGETHGAMIQQVYAAFGEPSVDTETGNVVYEDGQVSVEIGDRMLVRTTGDESAVEAASDIHDTLENIEPRGIRIEGDTEHAYIEAQKSCSYTALDDMR